MADNTIDPPEDDTGDARPGRRKLLLVSAGLALVVLVSVALTAVLMFAFQEDPPTPEPKALIQTPDSLEKADTQRLDALIQQQAETIKQLQAQVQKLNEGQGDESLKAAMADQEQRYQAFLVTMKEGMVDLANMVRGSRTWLEQYGARLDEAIQNSKAREQALLSRAESNSEAR
ncbi:hypothetical protein [Hydrocarboniclastica marina]|uniref:Uncharacterized protein n=1 Tax=Hydrocarboniclastica marina TaxID=2259620 RepID=A0A4P7XKG4_9ALTE|nr:hypothetical protein [Hydrocarboniclastica marina]QCF27303.1 hypothetical protein soil367_15955 [Hydrocarboniclastica marina]